MNTVPTIREDEVKLLLNEPEQDVCDHIPPDRVYPVWSPDRAFPAAAAMLQALDEAQT